MKKILLFVIGILLSTPVFAQSAAQQLVGLLQNVQTLQANFQQTITDSQGSTLQKSKGKMAMQRPGLFRWETLQPNQQLIVADGKFIWIYDKDLQQVTQQTQKISANTPGMLLSTAPDQLAKQFSISQMATKDGAVDFTLVPHASENNLFQSVDLYFRSGVLQSMLLHDNLNQMTQIQFSRVKTNSALPASLFRFHPPASVTVVSG